MGVAKLSEERTATDKTNGHPSTEQNKGGSTNIVAGGLAGLAAGAAGIGAALLGLSGGELYYYYHYEKA